MNGDVSRALLSVHDLVVEYHQPGSRQSLAAVRGVSLDIPEAGILALVGESGSGKTSLAHAILQLLPVAAGSVRFRGRDLGGMDRPALKQLRRCIQPVFQDPLASLSPRRTVLQTLLEPLDQFGIGSAQEREGMAGQALSTVDLGPELLERFPHELSGGQRQRVALARALVCEPELVIADEPVSSLDIPMQSRIIELVRELRDRLGIAFLFVSHDLSVVHRLADTVAVMYAGQLVETGPAARIFSEPAHPYTRALMRAVPVADPDRQAPQVLAGEPPSPLTPPAACVFHNRCAEAMAECARQEPADRAIAPGEENKTEETQWQHRVRCHLWNS